MEDAPPIEELLPGVAEKDRRRVLEREINKLIPRVDWALDCVGVGTEATMTDLEPNLEKPVPLTFTKVTQGYDLIDHYLQLPREGAHMRQEFSRLVIGVLDQGIGALEECRRSAVRRAFSPVSWLAWIVGFPIAVLERAGVPMDDATSKGVQAVAWALRLLMLVAVAFFTAKLGVSVPWDKIIAAIK